MKLVLPGEFVTLNEYIQAERGNKFAASKIKREETDRVIWECRIQKISVFTKPVKIVFTWYLKNAKKDPDNTAFSKKFILDGLVKAGILFNDNMEWIIGFEDQFKIDDKNPRVELKFLL